MIYLLLADMVVILHFTFILFVIFGGLLVWRWRKLIWVHLPLAIWGVIVEWGNFICPLTPLENHFRELGQQEKYTLSFTEEYIYPIIYIEGLDRELQYILGAVVIIINLTIYGFIFKRFKKHH
jgi:hypothetical protein